MLIFCLLHFSEKKNVSLISTCSSENVMIHSIVVYTLQHNVKSPLCYGSSLSLQLYISLFCILTCRCCAKRNHIYWQFPASGFHVHINAFLVLYFLFSEALGIQSLLLLNSQSDCRQNWNVDGAIPMTAPTIATNIRTSDIPSITHFK